MLKLNDKINLDRLSIIDKLVQKNLKGGGSNPIGCPPPIGRNIGCPPPIG